MPEPPEKLLYQVRDAGRTWPYSYATEQSCVDWIKRFILFHNKRHPSEMGRADIKAFLKHLRREAHRRFIFTDP